MKTETFALDALIQEIKLVDKRINSAFDEYMPIGFHVPAKPQINGMPVDQFEKEVIKGKQSLQDLIHRRDALVNAKIKANAETMVEVRPHFMAAADDAKESISIASAINRKEYYIKVVTPYVQKLAQRYQEQTKNFTKIMHAAFDEAQRMTLAKYESAPDKSGYNEDFENTKTSLSPIMCDPIEAKKTLEAWHDAIENYINEIDRALNKVNTNTEVSVEY